MGADGDPVALAGLALGHQSGRVARARQQAGGMQHVGDGAGAVVAAVAPAAVAAAPLVRLAGDLVGGLDRVSRPPPERPRARGPCGGRSSSRRGRAAPARAATRRRSRRWRRRARFERRPRRAGSRAARRRSPRPRRCARERARWTSRCQVPRIRFPVRFRGELTGSRGKSALRRASKGRRFAPTTWVPRSPGLRAWTIQRYTTRFNRALARKLRSSLPWAAFEGGQRRLLSSFGTTARNLSGRVGGVLVERLVAQQGLGERLELVAVLGQQRCASA